MGLPTTKHFFFSLILGCPQEFNFARPFWYGWVETGLNGRNGPAKLKSLDLGTLVYQRWLTKVEPWFTSWLTNVEPWLTNVGKPTNTICSKTNSVDFCCAKQSLTD